MAYEKNPDELGALWIKHGPKSDYMTGEINGVKVVVFAAKKTSDKSPDWRVLKSKPRTDTPSDQQPGKPLEDNDIPF
jgi:hypothetical protein